MSEGKILYHGTKNKINDRFFASETYFTDNIDIAKEYGNHIYSIDVDSDERLKYIFQKDILNEHYITNRLIPMYLFTLKIY